MLPVEVLAIVLTLTQGCPSEGQDCPQLDPKNVTCACKFGGLEVTTASGVVIKDENCNSMQNKNEFKRMPQVRMARAKCAKTYALFVLDPDVPGYPRGNFYNHLVLGNLAGEEVKDGTLGNGTTALCYNGPDPPPTTGTHRYMFLLYEQPQPNVTLKEIPDEKRANWSLATYLAEQQTRLCGPVGGTQFRTKA
ncbi:protein D2 [Orussus abietinus]|uniref:protein D2 n=1 Tax=Orussus abietinus TaxID=222816 RepID=UPI0006250DB9|nr:protein D2 [Orussus abietinus]